MAKLVSFLSISSQNNIQTTLFVTAIFTLYIFVFRTQLNYEYEVDSSGNETFFLSLHGKKSDIRTKKKENV